MVKCDFSCYHYFMKQKSDKFTEETRKMTPVSRGSREFSKDGDTAAPEPSREPREGRRL